MRESALYMRNDLYVSDVVCSVGIQQQTKQSLSPVRNSGTLFFHLICYLFNGSCAFVFAVCLFVFFLFFSSSRARVC